MRIGILVVRVGKHFLPFKYNLANPPHLNQCNTKLQSFKKHIVQTSYQDNVRLFMFIANKGVLQITMSNQYRREFPERTSIESLCRLAIAVYKKKASSDIPLEVELFPAPCFIERSQVFTLSDMALRANVRDMR